MVQPQTLTQSQDDVVPAESPGLQEMLKLLFFAATETRQSGCIIFLLYEGTKCLFSLLVGNKLHGDNRAESRAGLLTMNLIYILIHFSLLQYHPNPSKM